MIGAQQAPATKKTQKEINQILDNCATYPDYGELYLSSDIILTSYSDSGFNNETKARRRSDAHTFLSESEPIPRWNGPLLTIARIMKYVMSSAVEAEMGALFLIAK